MESLWTKGIDPPAFPPLPGEIAVDVLIIGGGLTGLLCAHRLQETGVPYALVEAERICSGITPNTTAKITSQHGYIYSDLIRRFGTETARLYLLANEEALESYRQLAKTVDCDFEEKPAYLYARDDTKKLEKEMRALERIGADASFVSHLPLPFPVAGGICFPHQAQFHPLKLAYAVARPLHIYENTKVLAFVPEGVVTHRGRIRAKKIIVATHFPFLNKHGLYFLKMFQHRSYVLALKNAPVPPGMYIGVNKKGLSFREHQGLLLLGGGSHRTGGKGGNWQELRDFAGKHYPEAKEAAAWATQDCMTLDGVPYIGTYGRHTPGLYVATGFNKWGMTSAMVAASLLRDLVQEKPNPYERVFSPHRTVLRPQLISNAAHAVFHLLTPTPVRCPHLGCALKYNLQEHSWDCPCHGSRFTEEGVRLNGPATGDRKGKTKKIRPKRDGKQDSP